MKLYAGFDCGGSHTRCLLVSDAGKCLGIGESGPSNYLFCGKQKAAESILGSIDLAFADAGIPVEQITGIFVASAAVEVFAGADHEAFFKEVTGCLSLTCDSDIMPVWFAGSRFKPAVAMISGTGAVTYLLRGDTFIKADGWGPQLGDAGSGYDVGLKALRLAARMADGRMQMNPDFYQAILAHYQVDPGHPRRLWRVVNTGDARSQIASAAAVADRLFREGNPVAEMLFEAAAQELFEALTAVLAQTENEQFPLLLSGGMLRVGSPLYTLLCRKAEKLDRITQIWTPTLPAVYSAAAIALYQDGNMVAAETLMRGDRERMQQLR